MSWKTILNDDPLPWLLEDDPVNPAIRFFALRDLMGLSADSTEVIAAQETVMTTGPGRQTLAAGIGLAGPQHYGPGHRPNTEKEAPIHYLRGGNSEPGFECSANDHLPCAWGAVKAMLASSKVPAAQRTLAMELALKTGIEFLLSRDPATADYPMGYATKPNRSWFKFGYPIGYVTDVLQNLEVLSALDHGTDPRLAKGPELLLSKQDGQGRWPLEYTYNGKTWIDMESGRVGERVV